MAAQGFPVQVCCRVLDVSQSGYYAWRTRPPSPRAIRHAWLTDMIRQVHTTSRQAYGSRPVHAELTLGRGITVGYHAVELLMRRPGLQGVTGRRTFRRGLRPEATAADLVNRNFARAGRDQLWVTDSTELPTREGKLDCAVVLDACSRRVIDAIPTAALGTNTLGMAIQSRRPAAGTLIHSDLGWLPASEWHTRPSSRPARRQTAISKASRARSVRMLVAARQPTISREKTSITNAT
jgi:putative transposase